MRLKPLPDGILGILNSSQDFKVLEKGDGPFWLQIASEEDEAE